MDARPQRGWPDLRSEVTSALHLVVSRYRAAAHDPQGNLQFEGISQSFDRTSSYSSGFGVVAEPFTTQTTLQADDTYVVVASDGLFSEEARGGGGGLDNEGVCQALVKAASSGASCTQLAEQLAAEAARIGSTDDITLVVIRLGAAA